MAAPEQLTVESVVESAVQTIFSIQKGLASLAVQAGTAAERLLQAQNGGGPAAVLDASHACRALLALGSATAPVVAWIGGPGGIAGGGAGGEGTGAGGGGGGGGDGGGASTEAAALRTSSAEQEETQGGERSDDSGEPPARKRARVAAAGGFVFAWQPVTTSMLSERKMSLSSDVARALRLNGGAPDSVRRVMEDAVTRKESYRFSVFALPSAPARRGLASWEPPARGAPGTQALNSKVVSYTLRCDVNGTKVEHFLKRAYRFFRRPGERGVAGSALEGALSDAEVGDELVFARRGTNRELFLWLVKRTQGCNEGDERGDDSEEPPARKRARVAAGTGARAAAAAAAAAAAGDVGNAPEPAPWGFDESGEPVWLVEKILRERNVGKRNHQVLVRWKGFSREHDSWEPVSELRHTDAYVAFRAQE